MPTTMYAKVRRVLVVLWLVRNAEWNCLSATTVQRRTGVDHRTVRRVLALLRRRHLVVNHGGGWMLTAKGVDYAARIQGAFVAADNARRAAECAR